MDLWQWPYAETLEARELFAVSQAVPPQPRGPVLVESTAYLEVSDSDSDRRKFTAGCNDTLECVPSLVTLVEQQLPLWPKGSQLSCYSEEQALSAMQAKAEGSAGHSSAAPLNKFPII